MKLFLTRISVLCGACEQRGRLCGGERVFVVWASCGISAWSVFEGWMVVWDSLLLLPFGWCTSNRGNRSQAVSWQLCQILLETDQSFPLSLSQRNYQGLLVTVEEGSDP